MENSKQNSLRAEDIVHSSTNLPEDSSNQIYANTADLHHLVIHGAKPSSTSSPDQPFTHTTISNPPSSTFQILDKNTDQSRRKTPTTFERTSDTIVTLRNGAKASVSEINKRLSGKFSNFGALLETTFKKANVQFRQSKERQSSVPDVISDAFEEEDDWSDDSFESYDDNQSIYGNYLRRSSRSLKNSFKNKRNNSFKIQKEIIPSKAPISTNTSNSNDSANNPRKIYKSKKISPPSMPPPPPPTQTDSNYEEIGTGSDLHKNKSRLNTDEISPEDHIYSQIVHNKNSENIDKSSSKKEFPHVHQKPNMKPAPPSGPKPQFRPKLKIGLKPVVPIASAPSTVTSFVSSSFDDDKERKSPIFPTPKNIGNNLNFQSKTQKINSDSSIPNLKHDRRNIQINIQTTSGASDSDQSSESAKETRMLSIKERRALLEGKSSPYSTPKSF